MSTYPADLGARVLDAVVREPGSSVADIAGASGTTVAATRRVLPILRSVGLIECKPGVDHAPAYWPGWRWRKSRGSG